MPQRKYSILHYKKSYLYKNAISHNSLSLNKCSIKKNLSSKLNYLTKYHSCKKKNLSLSKCLTQKKRTLSKIPTTTKKNLVKFCKKKFKKKIKKNLPKKKFQKKNWRKATKIFTLLNRGGEGRGHIPPQWSLRAYTATIGTEIGTKIGRYRDREKQYSQIPIVWSLWLVGSGWFVSFRFGSVCLGSDFCLP